MHLAHETAGASQHPAFPAPSDFWRANFKQASGATRRENAKVYSAVLWCGYASVVGGIIIVAVSTADRRGAVISWPVISSSSSSADGGSANRSGTDANRHARAYTTVVSAATIDTTAVDATACDTSAIG